jgi:hypothetical protein
VLAVLLACPALARVTGPCADCHTMHNSQDNTAMAFDSSGAPDASANARLLRSDCLGCHSAADGGTWKHAITNAPIVYNAARPTYGADAGDGQKQGLAGGNFYWVDVADANGHNIFSTDETLADAPGRSSGCVGECHSTFVGPSCRGCHLDKMDYISGGGSFSFHHADDHTHVITSASQGWYRFLMDKMNWGGVTGIEDPEWEHSATSTVHNVYFGLVQDKTTTGGMQLQGQFPMQGNSISGFCTGCHGTFHVQATTPEGGNPWIRHPSDAVLPAGGEYAAYTTYDPLVPVAKPESGTVTGTVTPGTDMVMCLSCHRAHGSPYPDMLRFPYDGMVAGGGGADGTGCFKCHTAKDGS